MKLLNRESVYMKMELLLGGCVGLTVVRILKTVYSLISVVFYCKYKCGIWLFLKNNGCLEV